MKTFTTTALLSFFVGVFLLPMPGLALDEGTVSGTIDIAGRVVDGEDESAKFEEYRELPDGVSGGVNLKLEKKDRCSLEFEAVDIAEDDQEYSLSGNFYGTAKATLSYDQLPHNFAYDALTLYSGVGSERLTADDALQEELQNFGSLNDATDALKEAFAEGALGHNLSLKRKTSGFSFDLVAFDPFSLSLEASSESREGERPFFGSFGLFNALEITEPIDYETTQLRGTVEYAKMPFFVSASYYVSLFENDADTVAWDNFFRATDRAHAAALFAPFSINAGPSAGLTDLPPDNTYHNLSLTGSRAELPLRSVVTATASWGWWDQDDHLEAFTTNSAIVPGAAGAPPFDASDTSNLPTRDVDAEVKSSLYNLRLTSRPTDFMNVSAKYRYYEYENDTDVIEFPGVVLADAVWEGEAVSNIPTGYIKDKASVDVAFDVGRASTLTLGYGFDRTKRDNREVSRQTDDIYTIAFDSRPCAWMDFRIAYEKNERDVDSYDFTAPFECTEFSPEGVCITHQLPFLVKFDEAERDRDRISVLATVYPTEPLAVTGSFTYGDDDFDESPFGLLEDRHHIYSVDLDYAPSKRFSLFAFYSYEIYRSETLARQWGEGGFSDPYLAEMDFESDSNWKADERDTVQSLGGGLNVAVLPERLDFRFSYTFSDSDGQVSLTSPVGVLDTNPFVPLDFKEVDDVVIQSLDSRFTLKVNARIDVALGYVWEKFEVNDFNNQDFTNIPETVSGVYNGAVLMGTLPRDYDVNIFYTRLTYAF